MSHYKTYKLSDSECRTTKPKAKLYKLRDGGALLLDVMPSGTKRGVTPIVFMANRKLLLLVNIQIPAYQRHVPAGIRQKYW